jgi:hypothetical protein
MINIQSRRVGSYTIIRFYSDDQHPEQNNGFIPNILFDSDDQHLEAEQQQVHILDHQQVHSFAQSEI